MGRLRSFLKFSAVTHVVLAAGVTAHSRLTDREAGIWVPMTLGFGTLGVAGYLLDR